MNARYKPEDREYYAKYIEAGHVLKLLEDGSVDCFGMEYENHNGPVCIECEESWCEHCRQKVDPCEGREPRLKAEAEFKAEREHKAKVLSAWDDAEALRKRIAELERNPA